MVLAVSLVVLVLPAAVMAAAVSVECAYTDADVVCEVYVNTDSVELRSGGVRLTYNPEDLSVNSAVINDTAWFFGAGSSEFATPNAIDTSVSGIVDLVVGKLDTNALSAGVTGTRVQIGRVNFERLNTNLPVISAGLARGGEPFVSFVNAVSGAPLDGTTFNTTVAERGDANADGAFNVADYGTVRLYSINNPDNFPPYADCNGDGTLNVADYGCIRLKSVQQ